MYPFLCIGGLHWGGKYRGWRLVARLAVIVLGFAVVTGPWTIRNYAVTGRLIFIRSMVGTELYKGSIPEAWGGHGAGFVKHYLLHSERERTRLLALGETAYNDQMREAAYQNIRSRPLAYLARCVARVFMWWIGDVDLIVYHLTGGRFRFVALGLISLVACTLTSILAILGWLAARRAACSVWVISLYCFFLPLPYYFVIVGFRSRATLTPFLLAYAAYWCAIMLQGNPPRADREAEFTVQAG